MVKTSELVNRFSAAAQRYEMAVKNMEARRKSMSAKAEEPGQDSDPVKP